MLYSAYCQGQWVLGFDAASSGKQAEYLALVLVPSQGQAEKQETLDDQSGTIYISTGSCPGCESRKRLFVHLFLDYS